MVIDNPPVMPPARKLDKSPELALVLGGGAFHGMAHVGVLKVLEEAGIPIDLIVGASVGSMVGCLYADNPHIDSLLHLVNTTKASNIFDFSLFRSKVGFVSGKKYQKFIRKNCNTENIEDLTIPFVAMTTDLINGVSVPLSSGPVAATINASSAIPMIFEPVKMYGLTLVDGGVLDNIPVDVARTYNPKVVIAVDIMADIDSLIGIDNFLKVGLRSLVIVAKKLKEKTLIDADVVITPNLKDIPYMSGKNNLEAYEAGIHAATEMLPSILDVLEKKGIKTRK
ncbi:MAG: patatin-like phospholipase family protein [bacterium]